MNPGRNFDYDAAGRTLGLQADWYEDEEQMQEDIAARWGQANNQQRQSFARDMLKNKPKTSAGIPAGAADMYDWRGEGLVNQAAQAAALGGAAQGSHLHGMVGKTVDALKDENDSRVAQSRELRRMQHEQELERMKQETERMKISSLIQRLGQQGGGYSNPAEGLYLR